MPTLANIVRVPCKRAYASPVTEQSKCWDLLGQKFDQFQTVRNKCQHCCGSMQTDATSRNIVGPNNVECCWPTMLRPFAWAFKLTFVMLNFLEPACNLVITTMGLTNPLLLLLLLLLLSILCHPTISLAVSQRNQE